MSDEPTKAEPTMDEMSAEVLAQLAKRLGAHLKAEGVALVIVGSPLGTGGTVALHSKATPEAVEALRLGLLNVAAEIRDTLAKYPRGNADTVDVRCIACRAEQGHAPQCPLLDRSLD